METVNDLRRRALALEKRNSAGGRTSHSKMLVTAHEALLVCDLADAAIGPTLEANPFGQAYVGTCDFGDCDLPTEAVVWAEQTRQHLSMCAKHAVMTLHQQMTIRAACQ